MQTPETQAQLTQKTIQDFGEQWAHFQANDGYYGSNELFEDIAQPFLKGSDFKGASVADIGSGTGRIVSMLVHAGAKKILAVEPSSAMATLRTNTAEYADRITYLETTGDRLPASGDLDFVVSFGVLHHIPEPDPVVEAAYRALRPGGKILVWLYGREGNELYLTFAQPVRKVTRVLPHSLLLAISGALERPLSAYAGMCHRFDLPMKDYMVGHIDKLSRADRKLTIYDQLNPAYAKYYRRDEAEALLSRAGFRDVRLYNRHKYSWTVIGTKPQHGKP